MMSAGDFHPHAPAPDKKTPDSLEAGLQKLLLQSSKLSAQLSSLASYPIVQRSASVLCNRSEDLARKFYFPEPRYNSIVETVKSDAHMRQLTERPADAKPSVPRDNSLKTDSIDQLIEQKRAELEATKKRESVFKTTEELKSCINYSKVPFFAQVVSRLNDHRLKKNHSFFNIFEAIADCSREAQTEMRIEQLVDCWNALSVIFGETERAESDSDVFGGSAMSVIKPQDPWPLLLTVRSRRVLELSYLKFIDRTLSQNPRESVIGGRPTIIDRVRAFCSIRAKRLPPADIERIETLNGTAPWMILFYLLRCGMFADISQAISAPAAYYQRADPIVTSFVKTFLDAPRNTLSIQARSQIQAEYNQRLLHGSQDPYKIALLKIVGRCELNKKSIPEIVQSSEDYVWLQLWLIKEDELSSPSTYCLADLQQTICDFGPQYFSGAASGKPGNPLNYYQILVLSGQFDKAVQSILNTSYHLEAIHTAIGCLYHMNSQCNIGGYEQIITDFLPIVKTVDRSSELHYILTLTMDPPLADKAHALIRSMVSSEGVDLILLFGDVLSDGRISEGLLRKYSALLRLQNEDQFIRTIIVGAAEQCVDDGRIVEALQLFNLCGQYDRVLIYLNRELARAYTKPWNKEHVDQLTMMAQSIVDYYSQQPAIQAVCSAALQHNCLLMLRILDIKELCGDAQWERALSTLELLDLIPMSGDIHALQASAGQFLRSLDVNVHGIISDLFLMSMQILYQNYQSSRQMGSLDQGRQAQIQAIRQKARSLLLLVGLMQHRIHAEVCGQMARLEVMMV